VHHKWLFLGKFSSRARFINRHMGNPDFLSRYASTPATVYAGLSKKIKLTPVECDLLGASGKRAEHQI
jgi:hypothetical protein